MEPPTGTNGGPFVRVGGSTRDKKPLSPTLARLAVGPGTKATFYPGPKGNRDKWSGTKAYSVVVRALARRIRVLRSSKLAAWKWCCFPVRSHLLLAASTGRESASVSLLFFFSLGHAAGHFASLLGLSTVSHLKVETGRPDASGWMCVVASRRASGQQAL